MWITRLAVPVALVLAMLFACLAPSEAKPLETVSAKDVLVLCQRVSGRNYTYSQATGAELAQAALPRPPEEASQETLEALLKEAGFVLAAVGPADLNVFLVERAGG